MRTKFTAVARALGRFAVAAFSSAGAAAAGAWIPLDATTYSAPLLGWPGGGNRGTA
jgi:hypothetical protein